MASDRLDSIINRVRDLPPLPQILGKVLAVINDPSSSAKDVGRVLALDQGLATRILRLANSAYYGFSRQVASVEEAIVRLGLGEVKSQILVIAAKDTLRRPITGYQLDRLGLWRHSLVSAFAASRLSRALRHKRNDEAFMAGLLHDVGKLILDEYVASEFSAILRLVEEESVPFQEAELRILGFDHAVVGAKVIERWALPSDLVAAVAYHHRPSEAEQGHELATLAHLGDLVSMMLGQGLGVDGLAYKLDEAALDILGLNQDQIVSAVSETAGDMSKVEQLLEI